MFKKKKESIVNNEKLQSDFMLTLYLNQRFVYDILAMQNDGFTEFYEIKNTDGMSGQVDAEANASLGTSNKFSFISTNIEGNLTSNLSSSNQNEKNYKKTHTPASLFMQAYQYLKQNDKIKELKSVENLNNVISGDFVELKSKIKINTMVELFETMSKLLDITEAFQCFDSNYVPESSVTYGLKKNINSVMDVINAENDRVKYGTCELQDKQLVLKLNKEFFINSDYSEIKNGEFRIIGKVLEVVPENQFVFLNRENSIGLYDESIFEPVKNAAQNMGNLNIGEFQDKVEGKTCVILPIAIGI